MKKILVLLVVCFTSYFVDAQIQMNSDFVVTAQRSVDGKQYHVTYGKHYPYKDTAQFMLEIPKTRRHVGEIAYVFNVDSTAINVWQFLGGIESNNFKRIDAFIPLSEKAAPNGVATLGATGKVPLSQLPAFTLNNPMYVQTLSEMLALPASVGDIVVLGDSSKSYALMTTPASAFTNWLEILSPIPSNTDLLPEGTVNLYSTLTRIRAALSGAGTVTYNPATGKITGTGATLFQVDSAAHSVSSGNYKLPYNGNATNYLGGDSALHPLPSSIDTTNKWVQKVVSKNDSTITVYKNGTPIDILIKGGIKAGGGLSVTDTALIRRIVHDSLAIVINDTIYTRGAIHVADSLGYQVIYTTAIDSVRNNAGTLEGFKNGNWVPQFDLGSGRTGKDSLFVLAPLHITFDPNDSSQTIYMDAASTSKDGYITASKFNEFSNKQNALISGTNIKTVNGISLLGSGDIPISGGSGGATISDSLQTYTSGSTLTVNNGVNILLIDPATLQSSLAITLPAIPSKNNNLEIYFGGTIPSGSDVVTTVTILANTGQTLFELLVPTTMGSGEYLSYKIIPSLNRWYAKR